MGAEPPVAKTVARTSGEGYFADKIARSYGRQPVPVARLRCLRAEMPVTPVRGGVVPRKLVDNSS
eukprot:11712614-Prorocentrum_lima.AAC.1